MSLLNISSMSFGALSANALRALNRGAALGGLAHETGEGGLTRYHLDGGDVAWELGSGYFGTRDDCGRFDPHEFSDKAAHSAFGSQREPIGFIARLRILSEGKAIGIKLCVGSRVELLAMCKTMLDEGTAPDFVIVDGAEGGAAAAPLEYEDNVGLPLTDALMTVHNALVATGLRSRIGMGASGKVATGNDIVKRLIQGADYTNSARAMTMAIGCIQAQRCHTNKCPVGAATHDAKRARALDAAAKSMCVQRYHESTVAQAVQLMASMGACSAAELTTDMLRKKVSPTVIRSYRAIRVARAR